MTYCGMAATTHQVQAWRRESVGSRTVVRAAAELPPAARFIHRVSLAQLSPAPQKLSLHSAGG